MPVPKQESPFFDDRFQDRLESALKTRVNFGLEMLKMQAKEAEPEPDTTSEDEKAMLEAYRRFICRSEPGAVFSWRSPTDRTIVVPEVGSLIIHPNEAVA